MAGLAYLTGVGRSPVRDFGRVVVQREQDTPSGIHGTAEAAVLQDGQPVGEDGYVLGMFTQIFLPGVAHQCPAGDIFHAGKNGEEMTAHIECLLSLFSIIPDILPLSKRKNKNRRRSEPAANHASRITKAADRGGLPGTRIRRERPAGGERDVLSRELRHGPAAPAGRPFGGTAASERGPFRN